PAGGQVAGVKREGRIWSRQNRRPEHPRPHRLEGVLGVSEVDEPKRCRLASGGPELEPFRPVDPVAHTIDVPRARNKGGETSFVVAAFRSGGFEDRGSRLDAPPLVIKRDLLVLSPVQFLVEPLTQLGRRDLSKSVADLCGSAP